LSSERIGFALRHGVFSPSEIREVSTILDGDRRVRAVFIPDGKSGYEAIEIASSILSHTRRIHAGTGVIRLLEHDPAHLTRRVQTLQGFSSNRFLLGVGTGSPGPKPGISVMSTLERIEQLKKIFQSFPSGVQPPEIYVAALKAGIAKRAVGIADGLLLNFCSPQHAKGLIEAVKPQLASPIEFGCYLKTFYASASDETAKRLMVQEFLNYDSAPQYHEMFLQDGTADVISELRRDDGWKRGPVELPRELLKVSLANPTDDESHEYMRSFRRAGVTIPVIYPYFPTNETPEFKLDTVKRIMEST